MNCTDELLRQYVETALWSSHDEDGAPLDRTVEYEDLPEETLAHMRAELTDFLSAPEHWGQTYATKHNGALDFWERELGTGAAAHDFWLTRNGHGAGFWDRYVSGEGDRHGRHLTEAAKAHGSCDLYLGDDGKVYAT